MMQLVNECRFSICIFLSLQNYCFWFVGIVVVIMVPVGLGMLYHQGYLNISSPTEGINALLEKELNETKVKLKNFEKSQLQDIKDLKQKISELEEKLSNKADIDAMNKECKSLNEEKILFFQGQLDRCDNKTIELYKRIEDLLNDVAQCKVLMNQVNFQLASRSESGEDSSWASALIDTIASTLKTFTA